MRSVGQPTDRLRVLIGAALVATLGAQAPGAGAAPPVGARGFPDTLALIARVRTLAAPALAGRGNGTPEGLAAAETVAAWFTDAGLQAAGDAGGWCQRFALRGGEPAGRPACNVVGLAPGRGRLAGRWIVLGAHHDHLGRVPGDSTAYHPGADDNASGVAALCELARALAVPAADAVTAARGVAFASFAGEEIGLQGANWFLDHAPVPRDSIDAMVNLDSVGRLRDGRLYVAGVGSAAAFPAIVDSANAGHGLRLEISRSGWEASDHVTFLNAGIPSLFLLTGPHEQYHTPADDWPLVAPDGLARVTAFARDLVVLLRGHAGPLPYVAVEGPPPARREARASAAGQRRAWFGVMPDFVEGAPGVRLAGVMPGSPAAAAGLVAGDLLVEFDSRPVANLQEYTVALRSRAPGDTVSFTVRRGDELLRRSAVLADRP